MRKQYESMLEDARLLPAGDSEALVKLPTQVLEQLAKEELVSTDESVRRGKEELDIAVAEFGADRTRQFTRAMSHSTDTLQRAFEIQRKLHDSQGMYGPRRRTMLMEIVSSCGQADEALDAVAKDFAGLRNLLALAPTRLEELTRSTVDLRTRLPKAAETLRGLQQTRGASVLVSIQDNVSMATTHLDEAEKAIDAGRDLAAKPARQQGNLVDKIRLAEKAIQQADQLLSSVEHAEENLRNADSNLDFLASEVRAEISEAEQFRSKGLVKDTERIDALVSRAQSALGEAESKASTDPLALYTHLISIDDELNRELETLRSEAPDLQRQQRLLKGLIVNAKIAILSAESLISTRGSAIDAEARSMLAEAQMKLELAKSLENKDTQQAKELAGEAAAAGRVAEKRSQVDIDVFNSRYRSTTRRALYTTNALEQPNGELRKAPRNRGQFLTDAAALKTTWLLIFHLEDKRRPARGGIDGNSRPFSFTLQPQFGPP